jgi:hypothetical protein
MQKDQMLPHSLLSGSGNLDTAGSSVLLHHPLAPGEDPKQKEFKESSQEMQHPKPARDEHGRGTTEG